MQQIDNNNPNEAIKKSLEKQYNEATTDKAREIIKKKLETLNKSVTKCH